MSFLCRLLGVKVRCLAFWYIRDEMSTKITRIHSTCKSASANVSVSVYVNDWPYDVRAEMR